MVDSKDSRFAGVVRAISITPFAVVVRCVQAKAGALTVGITVAFFSRGDSLPAGIDSVCGEMSRATVPCE